MAVTADTFHHEYPNWELPLSNCFVLMTSLFLLEQAEDILFSMCKILHIDQAELRSRGLEAQWKGRIWRCLWERPLKLDSLMFPAQQAESELALAVCLREYAEVA